MLKVWGRNTSINVQKVMWAVGELGLRHERIDIGGPFGKNNEPAYLAKNPNGLVPTLEEDDGFLLWESNAIVRYLAGKYEPGRLEPKDAKAQASAGRWMDWQLSVCGPAIQWSLLGAHPARPEKRDHAQIDASREKTTAAMKILDAELGQTRFVAGDEFSMGDIPVGLIAYRFRRLVPERSSLGNLERWYGELAERLPFKEHVLAIPFV